MTEVDMDAGVTARLLVVAAILLNCVLVRAYPEQGKYGLSDNITLTLTTDCSGHEDVRVKYGFEKTMFAGTTVTAHVSCAPDSPASISIGMYLVHSSCYTEQFIDCLLDVVNVPEAPFLDTQHKSSRDTDSQKVDRADTKQSAVGSSDAQNNYQAADNGAAAAAAAKADGLATPQRICKCRYSGDDVGNAAALPEPILRSFTSISLSCIKVVVNGPKESGVSRKYKETSDVKSHDVEKFENMENSHDLDKAADEAPPIDVLAARPTIDSTSNDISPSGRAAPLIATAPIDGVYFVLLRAISGSEGDSRMNFVVYSAEAKSSYGYLSAVDWPNYYFYMIMVIVYIIFQIAWLVMLACNWRDLLQIQYFIGAAILLGMIEKVVLFAEYESINKSGVSVKGAVIFAQIVSSLKRALSRVLIMLLCLGYGIVKPKLGPTLRKVLAAGIVYFLVASIEGCIRIQRDDYDSKSDLVAAVVLVVVEIFICSRIFVSLRQTLRTLRLRGSVVKLALYRHFAIALRLLVLASLAFIGWFMYAVRFSACISDIGELWLEEGFWQMLFTLLLLVIIILWRPSANNQRKNEQLAVDNRVFKVSISILHESVTDLKHGLVADADEEERVAAQSGISNMD